MNRYLVDAQASTVLVAARSSMGPLVFEAHDLRGWVEAEVAHGKVHAGLGGLEIGLASLRSGNDLYDAELRRRIDARRYPTCRLRMERSTHLAGKRFLVSGSITFHGVTRALSGTIDVEEASADRIVVTGTRELDIEGFDVKPPGRLMIKIYPDVQVQLFVAAEADTPRGVGFAAGS